LTKRPAKRECLFFFLGGRKECGGLLESKEGVNVNKSSNKKRSGIISDSGGEREGDGGQNGDQELNDAKQQQSRDDEFCDRIRPRLYIHMF